MSWSNFAAPLDMLGNFNNMAQQLANATATAAAMEVDSNGPKRQRSDTYSTILEGISHAADTNALVVGKPSKAKRKVSKQRMSKYASDSFARKCVFDALLPRFTLRMHLPFTGQLTSDKGKQGVHGDTSITYCFPKEGFLRQMLYKAQVDHQPWTRGFAQNVRHTDGTTNVYITNPYPFLTTGDDQNGAANQPNSSFSLATGDMLHQQNWNMGLIMKHFTRTYTFMNTHTMPCTLLIYEFVRADDKDTHSALRSPKDCWGDDLKSYEPMNNTNYQYTTNAQIALPQGSVTHSILDPGARPSKRGMELKSFWRTKNITSLVIGPGQSAKHVVYVPGFYVSARELNKSVYGALQNKTHCVMFIQQGCIAYEGDAVAAGKIGIGDSALSMRIESEASFVGLPNNKVYTSYECREDTYALEDQDYSLVKPLSNVPSHLERKLEEHENADTAVAQTDGSAI